MSLTNNNTLQLLKSLLFDIRVWVLILFLVRMENLNQPPLDAHSYRQTITLGIARNYVEWDANFLRPRTILCDSRPGYEITEFPILNYMIAGFWSVFGEQNWIFRLIGIIAASFGIWSLYHILRRLIDPRAALAGAVLFGTSVAFSYARKAMPDVFSVSLVLVGIHFAVRYLERGKMGHLLAFIGFAAIGMLSKIPAASAMVLLAPLVLLKNEIGWDKKGRLIGAGIAAVALMGLWYFVWIPSLEKEYGQGWYMNIGLEKAWHEIWVEAWPDTKTRFFPIALQGRLAFFAFLAGLVLMFVKKQWKMVMIWGLYSVVFLYFILQVGKTFSHHEYYIIPYVVVMASIAGLGLHYLLKNDWAFIAVLAIMAAEAIYWKKEDFFTPWNEQKFTKLETLTDQYIPKDAKILVNGDNLNPKMMYFAHRRGWSVIDRMKDSAWVAGENTVGMDYLVIDRNLWKEPLPWNKLYEDNEFQIYKVKKD